MGILIHEKAAKVLAGLDKETRDRIKDHLRQLAENPHAGRLDVVKLKGINRGPDVYRLRVGDFRVFYFIDGGRLLVTDIRRREQSYV